MIKENFLIFPIRKSLSKFRNIGYKKIIQNNEFEYGIKIKNIGNVPFRGGVIKNVIITPFKLNVNFDITSNKRFDIPPLNPGDVSIIWFDRTLSPISGQFWLNFNLETKNKIISFQNLIHFNIKNEHLLQQSITNILLIILTLITIGISISRLF
ncbi:MAG: hypothetical protein KJ646_02375 [Nanoarchaeota archaeon]|nr:hypothetical protein [Candidatus Woesearchaeota archaeon]MBU4069803.1 hypothetical protein [Nanoarchaeota archaeon]